MKIVYQTDYNGKYVGEVEADESPLEPGVYLIPGRCYEDKPPQVDDGFYVVRENDSWAIKEYISDEVVDETMSLAERVLIERDGRYEESYKMILDAYEMGIPVSEEIKLYRQALRDIEQQIDFPANVVWPKKPIG